jgi:hypothetical protein
MGKNTPYRRKFILDNLITESMDAAFDMELEDIQ